jgi:hypothetical protein
MPKGNKTNNNPIPNQSSIKKPYKFQDGKKCFHIASLPKNIIFESIKRNVSWMELDH